jgi:hypothetical protein
VERCGIYRIDDAEFRWHGAERSWRLTLDDGRTMGRKAIWLCGDGRPSNDNVLVHVLKNGSTDGNGVDFWSV